MNNLRICAKSIITIMLVITTFMSYSQVVINEYSASNLNTILDNYSSNEDWVELFNAGINNR